MYAITWEELTGETLEVWTSRRELDRKQYIARLGKCLPVDFYLLDIGEVPGVDDGVLRSTRDMSHDYNLDYWIERAARGF